MDADPPAPPPLNAAAGFPAPTRAAWEALVGKTLKGRGPDTLRWRLADGTTVEPLHTAADAPAASLRAPARPPRDGARPWDLRTQAAHPDPARANAQVLQDLEGGAASVLLVLDPAGRRGIAADGPAALAAVLARTLDGVLTDLAPVALDAGFQGPQAAEALSVVAGRGPAATLALHMDPLGAFAAAGASPRSMQAHLDEALEAGARLHEVHPEATLVLAGGQVVHEAGGSEAQELGFAAACALFYARGLERAGLDRAAAFGAVTLGLSADPRPLVTVAKLRAARALWARLAAACGAPGVPARIEARGSLRTCSRLDPWTNLLRLTACGFGAAAGGADAIVLPPFTAPFHEDGASTAGPFARRQARNTQLVLMEEAHLGRVADPAGGAWSIERLTDDLARAGWAVLQEIERTGGALAALREGAFAAEVAAVRAALARAVDTRRDGLIGVSEFPNLAEGGVELEPLEPAAPAPEPAAPAETCAPLAPWRAARPFELLRAAAASAPHRPTAFLALLGSVGESSARAGFARNLLAAGGIAAASGGADQYAPEEARLAVICGTDARYAEGAAAAARALKAEGARAVWLAGRPGELEGELRAAGVDGFLHAGVDAPELLQRLQAAE